MSEAFQDDQTKLESVKKVSLKRRLRAELFTRTSHVTRSVLGAAALAAVPLLTLVAPEIAYAQSSEMSARIGDTVQDPATGDSLTVIAIFDGAVLAEDYRLILTDPRIGAMVPDPDYASQFVEVTAVSTNATSGLVDSVTLSDGRTIAVARDVSDQIVRGTTPDSGSSLAATPFVEPNGNRNVVSLNRNGRDGDDGKDASIGNLNKPSAGEMGASRSPGSRVSSADVTADGGVFGIPPFVINFRNSGLSLYANGGDGGDGGDGGSFVGFTSAGRNGGAGAVGPSFTFTNSGNVSVSENGLFGMIVSSRGGDGGRGGDGAFGFTSNAGDGGRAGSGGNVTGINAASGNITTYGRSGHGIYVRSRAGTGGSGGDADTAFDSEAGDAGRGANGGSARATNSGAIFTFGANAHGVLGQSIGGSGGGGGDANGLVSFAGSASAGGNGGFVELDNRGLIVTEGVNAVGLLAQSIGGGGGDSGNSGGFVAVGASGGAGSNGGTVSTFNLSGSVLTSGDRAHGVLAQSIGGGGGSGGTAGGVVAIGSTGSGGGTGGNVTFQNGAGGLISTAGNAAHGVLAQSLGGGGGTGGSAGGLVSIGGSGGSGGAAGTVGVINNATILTSGDTSRAILAQSIGGGGGDGASAGGFVAVGGSGSGSGNGGRVSVSIGTEGLVLTTGTGSDGVIAQSIGGGGGNGASAGGFVAVGGTGARAGNGGTVNVSNLGRIGTEGAFSRGILAQSIGGGGGSGGGAGAFISIGGGSSRAGSGGTVGLTNRGAVTTAGVFSNALHGQSIGGGGGTGGSAGGSLVVIGGSGSGGGNAGAVNITNSGLAETASDFSNGIFAQSVGGGGGDGGQAASGAAFLGVAVGGRGSTGGNGGAVTVTGEADSETIDGVDRDLLPLIRTMGDFSNGILAQSIGGGGGNGGASYQGAVGAFAAVSVAIGGSSGRGGVGGEVNVLGDHIILTDGSFSHGILAQSVGGGGGNGGSAISASASAGIGVSGSVSVAVGGSGGSGGFGGIVRLDSGGFTGTSGDFAHGILAQSVGGGGGNGGFSIAATAAASESFAVGIPVGVGGSGGGGGGGSLVDIDYAGDLLTEGNFSHGLLAQSVGGGGGNGGFNVSGGVTASGAINGSIAVGVGGIGGNGGAGGLANSIVTGNVLTRGDFSTALVTQSVGGSGGTGGLNVSGTIAVGGGGAGGIAVGVGGGGGGGGAGGTARSSLTGDLLTTGNFAGGILTQSVGGGGGNGGVNVSGTISASGGFGLGLSIGVGGAGGDGGNGGAVTAVAGGALETRGQDAVAFLAQSLGGGGGNGALNVSGGITAAATGAGTLSVGVGGSGGTAGSGGTVSAALVGTTITSGENSEAIIAQSLGGSGGNGAINVSAGVLLTSIGGNIGVGIGGSGGGGGSGGNADLTIAGDTQTSGTDSTAVLVQSLGGGGGNGGLNLAAGLTVSTGISGALGVGIGGKGGDGGAGGSATLNLAGMVITQGDQSTGVIAQSLGGGGGNGSINVTGIISAATAGTGTLSVGVGGFGGSGGAGGAATATIDGLVQTSGMQSMGALVQSLGGGGGNGGLNVSGSVALSSSTAIAPSVGLGGFGGAGGNGSVATLTRIGDTMTTGALSNAITVQSIGGGGGNGGTNIAGGLSFGGAGSYSGAVGIGGFGASAGNGGAVLADVTGSAVATGFFTDTDTFDFGALGQLLNLTIGGSHGIFAQSVGGSGGSGGINISGGIALTGASGKTLSVGIGGFGAGGGNGGAVDLIARGDLFSGIGDGMASVSAQSVGGGGGDGGLNIAGGIAMNGTLTVGIGGFGASGGAGGDVTSNVEGDMIASGISAAGLRAQSVGGGGGNGGVNITGGIGLSGSTSFPTLAFGLGGTGGDGSAGGAVDATQSGMIVVSGAGSTGVDAQSVGGGGGNGGLNIAAAIGASRSLNLGIGVGGSGGAGSTGGAVSVTSDGAISVDAVEEVMSIASGDGRGISAQSIGGGGGNAGFNVAGVGTNRGAPLTLGIGGSGGDGGAAGSVDVTRGASERGLITVSGDDGIGLFAQSIGGGGGNAGGNLLLSGSLRARFDVQLAIGGAGGSGANGGSVIVNQTGDIAVTGDDSRAIMAQSIGGGGGNAAVNINASLVGDRQVRAGEQAGTKVLDVQIGGGTGAGSAAGAVTVTHDGSLTTTGARSVAVLAQSIGGGGGNAASNYSQNINDAGQLSVAIGRIGGTGGLGGAVSVNTAGIISTEGDSAHAVHAQSIGGGGGNSETTAISLEGDRSSQSGSNQESATQSFNLEFALGLEGGTGASAGIVSVDNSAMVQTLGIGAHGLYAQSIGGGGGNGGAAIIDRFSEIPSPIPSDDEAEGEYSLSVQIGGAGGSGSFGEAVNVTNSGTVLTFGDTSNAIRAISVGGGGGDAGAAFNVDTPGRGDSVSLGFTLGGTGGPGSDGGLVDVTNLGVLQTSGASSAAIFAQSIGGGGGNAGLAGNFSFLRPGGENTATVIGLNIGGEGGTGGAGGDVSVTNGSAEDGSASILTTGEYSHGIHAQSIGGGGGNGGSTLSVNGANSSSAYQLAVNIGGMGGSGGIGGDVTVANFGSIETRGAQAHGIFAQSIGGGGGNGGLSLALGNLYASRIAPRQALIAIGGGGGVGNDAGDVVVTNSGTIVTSGENANGILAQSLGGGGGNMSVGLGITFDPRVNVATNLLANGIGFLLGADPGEGGQGGAVTINQLGDVTVSGDGARGVVGESINGGGGGLSIDLNGIVGFLSGELLPGALEIEPISNLPELTLFGGAAGQGDANAELVTLNLVGNVRVLGDNGAGLFQQSIGGGGGQFDLSANFSQMDDPMAVALPVRSGLGGSDSTNVNGGDVVSTQTGDAITQGMNTPAVFLQSIGGGGGRSVLDFTGQADQIGAIDLMLGGTNQASAAGGNISHNHQGMIATLGANSIGLLAQSIGGGGGLTQFSFAAPEPIGDNSVEPAEGVQSLRAVGDMPGATLTLGAVSGSGLDGGDVAIVQTGDTITSSDNAPALLVQSIGGGGGQISAEGVHVEEVVIGATGGATGSGGAVSLSVDGMVATQGNNSDAIILQSIGGGGGTVLGTNDDTVLTLSSDNRGFGGALDLILNGDVIVEGAGGRAIVAQSIGGGGGLVGNSFAASAGGIGVGGAIDILLNGNVSVTSPGGTAILAQSLGSDGRGDITVELAEESAIALGEGGVALAFDGGAQNTFINRGMIVSPDGLETLLMTGTNGNDRIENFSILVGNVALGSGINALNNNADAVLLTGSSIDLGNGESLLANAGTFAAGGTDTIIQTQLNGGFTQSETGISFFEVDLASDTHDAINAAGAIMLGGQIDARLLNISEFTPGMKAFEILTGEGGANITQANLRADSSVVFNLLGIGANGNAIELRYDMTFAPQEAVGNQGNFGEYLNRVQTEGVPADLAPTFNQLIAVQDVAEYTGLLTQLGGGFYAQQDALTIGMSQDFGSEIVNCGNSGFARDGDEKASCVWVQGDLANSTIDPVLGTPRSKSDILSFSGGAHYSISDEVTLAIGVGYDDIEMLGFDSQWAAKGSSIQIGAGVSYLLGATKIGAFATYSQASFDTVRIQPAFELTATGSRDVTALGAQLTISHQLEFGDFEVLGQLSGGITALGGGDSLEMGADRNNLALEQSSGTYGWAMPELRIGYTAALSQDWSLRPFIGGAWRYHLSDPVVTVRGRFAADTTNAAPFVATTPLDRSHLAGQAGLELFNTDGLRASVSYRLQQSSNRDNEGAQVNLVVPF